MTTSPDASGSRTSAELHPRGPSVRVPPPLIFLAGWGAGWAVNRWLEFRINHDGPSPLQTVSGTVLLLAGFAVMFAGMATFFRARTAIVPLSRARTLVTGGPYRFTRNPMYLGLTLAYVGGSLVMNQAWPLILLPVVLAVFVLVVIHREERYLRAEFGDAYETYCRRVRRFL